jgi:hypothetical protein
VGLLPGTLPKCSIKLHQWNQVCHAILWYARYLFAGERLNPGPPGGNWWRSRNKFRTRETRFGPTWRRLQIILPVAPRLWYSRIRASTESDIGREKVNFSSKIWTWPGEMKKLRYWFLDTVYSVTSSALNVARFFGSDAPEGPSRSKIISSDIVCNLDLPWSLVVRIVAASVWNATFPGTFFMFITSSNTFCHSKLIAE